MSANSTPIQTPGLSFHLEDFPTTRLRTPGIKTTPFVTISPSFSSLPADDLERQEPASTGGADQHDQLLPSAIPPKDTNWATSKAKRVRANVRELRKSSFGRLFLYLSLIAGVMVCLNIVQIATIGAFGWTNKYWIAVAPAAVFVAMIIPLLVWMCRPRNKMWDSWREADASKRIAWLGIVMSILLPVVLCEFGYLNWSAVPTYQTIVWTTAVDAPKTFTLPTIVFYSSINVSASAEVYPVNLTGPYAQYMCDITQDFINVTDCDANVGAVYASGATNTNETYYRAIDFTSPEVKLNNAREQVAVNIPTFFNGPGVTQSATISCALIDPTLMTYLASFLDLPACAGQTPTIAMFEVPAFGSTLVSLTQYTVNDPVGALVPNTNNASCPYDPSGYPSLSYWTAEVTTAYTETDISNCNSTTAYPVETFNCSATVVFEFLSPLTTTQTSSQGTTWKQMLLDEGSIVGGIQFFTWFLSIYVI